MTILRKVVLVMACAGAMALAACEREVEAEISSGPNGVEGTISGRVGW